MPNQLTSAAVQVASDAALIVLQIEHHCGTYPNQAVLAKLLHADAMYGEVTMERSQSGANMFQNWDLTTLTERLLARKHQRGCTS
jgi:hypothetical protein